MSTTHVAFAITSVLALASAPGCHHPDEAQDSTAPDAGAPPSGDAPMLEPLFHVTVQGGFGSGDHHTGDVVEVWADLDPTTQVLAAWSNDASLLARPTEWHTTFVMPARDVTLAATSRTVAGDLTQTTFTGPSSLQRTVYARIPTNPKGLVMFFHGTGGSASMILKVEASAVARVALDRGYGVLATEAAEVVAGDLDGNGKIRWSTAPSATNKDFIDLDALVAGLRSTNKISATTPIYLLGMSNGGAMSITLGSLGASSLAATFPHLRFKAVVSHCADGPADAANVTVTPTAWRQCAHDDNVEVSNTDAKAHHATLVARGVDTDYLENPASALYDARFLRAGVDLTTSTQIASELRAYTDAAGMFASPSAPIMDDLTTSPSTFPVLSALPGATQSAVRGQVRVMEAEHEMFSDLAASDLAWFDSHP